MLDDYRVNNICSTNHWYFSIVIVSGICINPIKRIPDIWPFKHMFGLLHYWAKCFKMAKWDVFGGDTFGLLHRVVPFLNFVCYHGNMKEGAQWQRPLDHH